MRIIIPDVEVLGLYLKTRYTLYLVDIKMPIISPPSKTKQIYCVKYYFVKYISHFS